MLSLTFSFMQRVKRYLKSHGIHKGLLFDPEARHGEILLASDKGMKTIVTWIKDSPSSSS